jgi:uncharacterized protein (TIGR03437 family)
MQLRLIAVLASTTGLWLCQGQNISTVAGTGTCCADADGGAATSAYLQGPDGLTFDVAGNLYIWESQPSKIRKVSKAGIISTVAGSGTPGYGGDGGPATGAQLLSTNPHVGLVMDGAGNLYICDGGNQRIRKVAPDGTITTVAGNGSPGFSGDGGPATTATLWYPSGIAMDRNGNLYIADSSNYRIRKVAPDGTISTVAGNGNVTSAGDGGPAISASFGQPRSVAVDGAGNIYIAEGKRIRKVNPAGIISTIAGIGTSGFSGDGGPAASAQINAATGMAVDRSGNLYFADTSNQRIRKVDAAGNISTISGTGFGFSGDGGPAANAQFRTPHDLAFDAEDNLYVSDTGNHRIRKIAAAAGALALVSDPPTLSFAYSFGDSAPASQSVSVNSTGASQAFSATSSTSSGGSWLSVNPTSGSTPASIDVSVNPAGLPGGVYEGAITITSSTSGVVPLVFAVTFTVTAPDAPAPGSILNASGHQSKLAPGALFVVNGKGMGPDPAAVAAAPSYPTELGGTSVSFAPVGGGDPIPAMMVSTAAGQLIGMLPSSAPVGDYQVVVSYNGLAGNPSTVTVVARSLGIDTVDGSGAGPAKATFDNINGGASQLRLTSGTLTIDGADWTFTPAHAGDTLVLTGTGGGADPLNDTGDSAGDQSQNASFTIFVGSREIAASFAGTLPGYPGVWQIKFTLPDDIETGCFLSLQVRADGELGNQSTIAIAASDQTACSDPQLSPDALAILDGGGTIVGGGFGIAKETLTTTYVAADGSATTVVGKQEIIAGGLAKYTAAEYAAISPGTKIGACTVVDRTAPANAPGPSTPSGYADLGSTIPASGPGLADGSALAVMSVGPVYGLLLADGTIVAGGQYSLDGTGGADVGPFDVTVPFPVSFAVTDWDSLSSIDRSQPLALNWTSQGADQAFIIISSSQVVGKDASNTNIIHNVIINCQTPAAAGSFTVPAEALAYLLPESIDVASLAKGAGILAVEAGNSQLFNPPLAAGGQVAWAGFQSLISVGKNLVIK